MTPNKSRTYESGRFGRTCFFAGALLAIAAAGAAHAKDVTYRYYKFTTTATLGGINAIQMSEFRFLNGTATTNPVLASGGAVSLSPSLSGNGNGEGPENLLDGVFTTKWFNFGTNGKEAVVFDYGTPTPPTINGYTFRTAQSGANESNRNPSSWRLEASNDSETGPWTLIDVRDSYPTPTTAQTELPPFTIPESVSPVIDFFTVSDIVMLSGNTTTLAWETTLADTVTLSPYPDPVLEDDAVAVAPPHPPANTITDTVYTLTADSAAADPVTKQLTVRVVDGGTADFRYIRFTPVLTQGGDFQMADLKFFDDGIESVPATVLNADGSPATGGADGTEGPLSLIDGDTATKWFSGTLVPVIIDMGEPAEGESPKSYDSYQFVLGGDANGYPGRNPLRWKLEGSDTMETWSLIEDFTAFSYPTPAVNNAVIDLPLPGLEIIQPPLINSFSAEREIVGGVETIIFNWDVSSADTVSINVEGGEALPSFGPHYVETTGGGPYVISATNVGGTSTKLLNVGAVPAVPPTIIDYDNFNTAGAEMVLLGDASLINDSPQIPAPGNVVRLRLTPDEGGKLGVAWFDQRVAVNGSFDTTFDLQLSCKHRGYGAEGLGFVIQNTSEGLAALPQDNGPATNAFTVKFSTWENADGVLNEARINLFGGATKVGTVDLRDFPAISLRGAAFATLTGPYTATPYAVRIAYVPGDLDIWVDGVQVITDLNIDIEDYGAVDSSGTAFVGFVARTGGWDQASDISSWSLTGTAGLVEAPLAVTASSIDPVAGTATFTWSSTDTVEYLIRSSTDLVNWSPTPLKENIPATGASTTDSVSFTPGTKMFFRVEEE